MKGILLVARRVLGIRVADSDVERILRALGMQVASDAEGWQVTAPTRRFDIAIEEVLIEEIARIHGYEAIPVRTPAGVIFQITPEFATDGLPRSATSRLPVSSITMPHGSVMPLFSVVTGEPPGPILNTLPVPPPWPGTYMLPAPSKTMSFAAVTPFA